VDDRSQQCKLDSYLLLVICIVQIIRDVKSIAMLIELLVIAEKPPLLMVKKTFLKVYTHFCDEFITVASVANSRLSH